MIGGSSDAFIGAIHRKAANLDGEIELVCGAFSSSPEKSKATGATLYLNPQRVYGSFEEKAPGIRRNEDRRQSPRNESWQDRLRGSQPGYLQPVQEFKSPQNEEPRHPPGIVEEG